MKRLLGLLPFSSFSVLGFRSARSRQWPKFRFAYPGAKMNIYLGVMAFVMLGLGPIAFTSQLEISDPPRVPQSLQSAAGAKALEAKREELLAKKKAWMADVEAFNRATAHPVSESEAAQLQQWQRRLLTERANYLQAIDHLKLEISAARAQVKLAPLRERLYDTQRALRQLQRQSKLTNEELEHWRDVTECSVEHAQEMLVDMLTDALLSLPAAHLEGTYKEIEKSLSAELQHAASLIAGETEPARRERLQAAFQLLNRQREATRQMQHLLGNFHQAQEAKALDELAQLPEGKQFKAGIHELLLAVGDEKLQESLQHDFGLSFPVMTKLSNGVAQYRYAERVVDAAYDATSVSLAWKQIRQQNDTAEKLLKAVDRLGEHVETLVKGMKEIEAAMPTH